MSSVVPKDVSDPAQIEPVVPHEFSLGAKPHAEGNSAFFYGTLMHPRVLRRVISNDASHLEICSAILFDHTRLHVKYCDYPAVVSSTVSCSIIRGKVLSGEDQSVRGVVVRGLTAQDIALLDVFEGYEYRRESVTAVPISPWNAIDDAHTQELLSKSTTLPDRNKASSVPAFVYVWDSSPIELEPNTWSYDVFVKEKLWRWVDGDPRDQRERKDDSGDNVDMAGVVVAPQGGEGVARDVSSPGHGKTEFGHPMLKHFGFAKGYINLNNGSFGAAPLPVCEYFEEINRLSESQPDPFFRTDSRPMLNDVRSRLARMINAETDEVVFVPNATHGINTVLRNFVWQEGDILIDFSTSYGAVSRTVRYLGDTEPHPTVQTIPLIFPTTHAKILKTFREHMESLPDTFDQKVVVVIDSMVSAPGVILPWEEMVDICKEHRAFSLIDAAHGIGLSRVDLSRTLPDFWVSNCHKWLMTKRGCAILYVPRRHHHLIRTSFPTSWGYVSPPETAPLAQLFEWTGTIDYAPYLSAKAALIFRESIGGEESIQRYCNTLALQGGNRMAEILGTETIDPKGEYTGPMTNVRLPLDVPGSLSEPQIWELSQQLIHEFFENTRVIIVFFVHNGSFWARACAQIWNEMSDFELAANGLKAMCERRKGSSQGLRN